MSLERILFWKSEDKDSKSGYKITKVLIQGKISSFSEPWFICLTDPESLCPSKIL